MVSYGRYFISVPFYLISKCTELTQIFVSLRHYLCSLVIIRVAYQLPGSNFCMFLLFKVLPKGKTEGEEKKWVIRASSSD